MAEASVYGEVLQAIVASAFALVNLTLVVRWRKHWLFAELAGAVLLLAAVCCYLLWKPLPRLLLWPAVLVVFVALSFLCSEKWNARTLFVLLCVLSINMAAGTLSVSASHLFCPLWVQLPVALALHAVCSLRVLRLKRAGLTTVLQMSGQAWLLYCQIPLVSLLSMVVVSTVPYPLARNPDMVPAAASVSLMVLVLHAVLNTLFRRTTGGYRLAYTNTELQMQSATLEKQLEKNTHSEVLNAIFRHDIRHFVSVIQACLMDGRSEEALETTRLLSERLEQTVRRGGAHERYCLNPVLDSVLAHFAELAQAQGIEFTGASTLPAKLEISSIELAVLLANTIENAINACCKLPQEQARRVTVQLKAAGEQIFIHVGNSCAGPVLLDKRTGLPKPTNTEDGHGVGVASIHEFVCKHHALVDCTQEKDFFTIRFVI